MLSFIDYLNEERNAAQAQSVYDRTQRIHGFGKLDPRKFFGGIGTHKSLGTKPSVKEIASSLVSRTKHYPDDPKKRPSPTEKTVPIRNLVTTQANIKGSSVKKYIKHYSEHPEKAKEANIETFPHKDDTKLNVGDGHHRLAALKALGYKEVKVKHYER